MSGESQRGQGRIDELLRRLGVLSRVDPPPLVEGRTASVWRAISSGVIALTGVSLLVPNALALAVPEQPFVGLALAVLGSLVSVGLVAAGVALYRSSFTARNAARIAIWNLLGLVVLGFVMVGLVAYQRAAGGDIVAPAFTIANLLAIGAAAHVIIGVYDARRVRAEQLAIERQKLAVLNRVLRHNLRNEATVIGGNAELVERELADLDAPDRVRDAARTVRERSAVVGTLADEAKQVMRAFEQRGEPTRPVNVADAVADAVAAVREAHPAATIEATLPEDVWVEANDGLAGAIEQLVENGVVHAGADDPRVEIEVQAGRDDVVVSVRDEGPGIHEDERAVITGEREITQLSHGSGLGLWVVRAVADACDATLTFDESDRGSVVALELRRSHR